MPPPPLTADPPTATSSTSPAVARSLGKERGGTHGMGKSWEIRGKMLGKSWESLGKMLGKSWESLGKMLGTCWDMLGNVGKLGEC